MFKKIVLATVVIAALMGSVACKTGKVHQKKAKKTKCNECPKFSFVNEKDNSTILFI